MKTTTTTAAHTNYIATLSAIATERATVPQNQRTTTDREYTSILYAVAIQSVYSVLKKCIQVGISDSAAAQNKLYSMRRDVTAAAAVINAMQRVDDSRAEYVFSVDRQGRAHVDRVQTAAAAAAAEKALENIGGDGMDLVQTAAAALLDEIQKATDSGRITDAAWIEKPYTEYVPARRVSAMYGKGHDSEILARARNKQKEVEIVPIKSVYRAVRAAIQHAAAIRECGYTYIEDLATDDTTAENALYIRCPKLFDMGDTSTAADAAAALDRVAGMIEKMQLQPRELAILDMLQRGKSAADIAAECEISVTTVKEIKYSIQRAAVAAGYAAADMLPCSDNTSKPKEIMCIRGDDVSTMIVFDSVHQAAAVFGVDRKTIRRALATGRQTKDGYTFRFM